MSLQIVLGAITTGPPTPAPTRPRAATPIERPHPPTAGPPATDSQTPAGTSSETRTDSPARDSTKSGTSATVSTSGSLVAPTSPKLGGNGQTAIAGGWLVTYQLGTPSQRPYSMLLRTGSDAECASQHVETPCVYGNWWNIIARNKEGPIALHRSGATVEGADTGGRLRYSGTLTAGVISGTVSDSQGGTGTFRMTRGWIQPGTMTPVASVPGAVDMRGYYQLHIAGYPHDYSYNLSTQAPDDLCQYYFSGTSLAHYPCFRGQWRDLAPNPNAGEGFFAARSDGSRLADLAGIDVSGLPPTNRYTSQSGSYSAGHVVLANGQLTVDGNNPADFTLSYLGPPHS